MAEATADIKELGDKIVGLTLKQAVDLGRVPQWKLTASSRRRAA
jgi:hypothetical protein